MLLLVLSESGSSTGTALQSDFPQSSSLYQRLASSRKSKSTVSALGKVFFTLI